MDRNTVVRIAIPLSLYESVKGKVLSEALNKDIKAFGQDLDNKLKAAGIKTLILVGKESTPEQRDQVKKTPGLAILEVSQTPETQLMVLYYSPKDKSKVMKAVDYFQLIPYDGQVLKKGWSAKQVKGAINPGDIYKQESGEGQIQFIRLAKTDPKVKTVSETEEPKENENASGWQIYSSEGKYPNIKYEPVNDKVYKTEDEAKHIASIINKQYPNSRVYVKPAGSIDEAKKAAEKKAADIKKKKEAEAKKAEAEKKKAAEAKKKAKA
jgi:hypothetical protein